MFRLFVEFNSLTKYRNYSAIATGLINRRPPWPQAPAIEGWQNAECVRYGVDPTDLDRATARQPGNLLRTAKTMSDNGRATASRSSFGQAKLWNTRRNALGKICHWPVIFGIPNRPENGVNAHFWRQPVTPGVAGSSPVHSAKVMF